MVSVVEWWDVLTLSLTSTEAFIPNWRIKYWWGSTEVLLWIPYKQSVFQCFGIVPPRSCNWVYGVWLYGWTVIHAYAIFDHHMGLYYWWGSSENLLWIPYQQSTFQCFVIIRQISCNWLWGMISMTECWDLLTYAIFDYDRGFTSGGTVLKISFGSHINNHLFNTFT